MQRRARLSLLVLPLMAAACGNNHSASTPTSRSAEAEPPRHPHHDITVRVEPESSTLEVEDVITLPAADGPLRFEVHAGLDVTSLDPAYRLEAAGERGGAVPVAIYLVTPTAGRWPAVPRLRLRLRGTIHHPLATARTDYGRSDSGTPGTISAEGVLLGGASHWLPRSGDAMFTFRMEVDLPAGWEAVSQGARVDHARRGARSVTVWETDHPMEEAYLIANRFHRHEGRAGDVAVQVYLRQPDETLAAAYIEAARQYVPMYSALLGDYPYPKLAAIENFWETGYGMPSFTLLGPRVMRLPFILHSSFPHEIVHNWWGNGVYVAEESGNWSEGLTAYLADHLIAEARGDGGDYRRGVLEKYRSYVREGGELTLAAFRSRHSSASEAVGYGKALMLFHMLRVAIGDEAFVAGLRRFYREHRFDRAGYGDLADALSAEAGRDLAPLFEQWVNRSGAPALRARAEGLPDDRVRIVLTQETEGAPYALLVPVAVTMAGRDAPHLTALELVAPEQTFELELPAQPLRVDVDPYFDVFRRIAPAESPPALAELFGAEAVTIVLPADAAQAWKPLAEAWSHGAPHVKVTGEKQLSALPGDRAVWVLGAKNRWAGPVRTAMAARGAIDNDELRLGGEPLSRAGLSTALVARRAGAPPIGWLATDTPAAIAGLARKLPHYGKYSYLAFTGDEPTNVAKGQWPVDDSPLSIVLAPGTAPATLPARAPLARPDAPTGR